MELFDSIGSVPVNEEGFCSIPDCSVEGKTESFCRLSAVCQKLTGYVRSITSLKWLLESFELRKYLCSHCRDEYMKEACSTCEQVRCDDDEECTIGENGLPQCTEIIEGGCDDKDK